MKKQDDCWAGVSLADVFASKKPSKYPSPKAAVPKPQYPGEKAIKPSPEGKYDLNFIDWENESERIIEAASRNFQYDEEINISPEELKMIESIYNQEADSFTKEHRGIPIEAYHKLPIIRIIKNEGGVMCSICIDEFKKGMLFKAGDSIRKLACKHKFHDHCLVEWINLHSECPMCRKSIV